jgi:hypothetical protein
LAKSAASDNQIAQDDAWSPPDRLHSLSLSPKGITFYANIQRKLRINRTNTIEKKRQYSIR